MLMQCKKPIQTDQWPPIAVHNRTKLSGMVVQCKKNNGLDVNGYAQNQTESQLSLLHEPI